MQVTNYNKPLISFKGVHTNKGNLEQECKEQGIPITGQEVRLSPYTLKDTVTIISKNDPGKPSRTRVEGILEFFYAVQNSFPVVTKLTKTDSEQRATLQNKKGVIMTLPLENLDIVSLSEIKEEEADLRAWNRRRRRRKN